MGCAGMNRLIGITGGMSAGKTTLSKKIIRANPDFLYIDMDIFRRSLYQNKDYVEELKRVIPELRRYLEINSPIINKYIYTNPNYMNKYKKILYKYLFKYLNTINNKTILIDWALIVNDNLQERFDKIIFLDIDINIRLKRSIGSDLQKEEILKRFELQKINNLESYASDKFLILNNGGNDMEKINNFINGMECKFTLPNNEGKAIWEITNKCNYNCSYCIFSCDSNNNKNIKGELTTEECFHIVDELSKNDFKHLKITGGEPFIRKDILKILDYASKKLFTDISTNASLLTPDKIDLLNELKLKMIHVSLDGTKSAHESVRGQETYDKTMQGLNLLRKSTNRIRIGSVIHRNNENNLEELVNKSIEVAADEIIFSIMEPMPGQDMTLVKTRPNPSLIEEIELLKEKYKNEITINYNFGNQPTYIQECPAGDKFLYINNYGNISPCPWVYENNRNCISKISLRNHSLEDIKEDERLKQFLLVKSKGQCYGKI